MAVARFLGASWAGVHGPADPRRMLLWTLSHGFRGLWPAPGPRAVDWAALYHQRENLPFAFAGTRVSGVEDVERPAEAGLASTNPQDRVAALAAVESAVALARSLGCGRVVLDPGIVQVPGEIVHTDLGDRSAQWSKDSAAAAFARRNAQLDRALEGLCRGLHRLHQLFPDVAFCLTLSRNVLGLGEVGALAAVFEDLSRCHFGYWHDTVAAACRESLLCQDPGTPLELFSKHLQGMSLGDYWDGECALPPGAGGVDYPLLSAYRQPTATGFPVVIELDPGVDPGEIPGIHAYLSKFGL